MAEKTKATLESDLSKLEQELARNTVELMTCQEEIRLLLEVITLNNLEDSVKEVSSKISDEEKICRRGIYYLSKLFESGNFSKDDASTFDILYKNLRSIKGIEDSSKGRNKKEKPKSVGELLSIVKDIDNNG